MKVKGESAKARLHLNIKKTKSYTTRSRCRPARGAPWPECLLTLRDLAVLEASSAENKEVGVGLGWAIIPFSPSLCCTE